MSHLVRFLCAVVLGGEMLAAAVLRAGLAATENAAESPAVKPFLPKPPAVQGVEVKAPLPKAPLPKAPLPRAPLPAQLPAAKVPESKTPPTNAGVVKTVPDDDNSCIQCHATLTDKDQKRFYVTVTDLASDIHWQRGLRCHDCHGGDPTVFEIKAHQARDDFRTVKSPADIPEFCGDCHANVEFMRRFLPSPRTDQLKEYWTSGHGQRLKKFRDLEVATCVSCHGKPHGSGADTAQHGIRRVSDQLAPVYHTRVAQTCAKCHADTKLMAGRTYNGRPLACDEYAQWSQSVHGKALLEKGDLSAPACNNCHGNHGAVPPQIGSVANACGSCHGKIAKLFAATQMKHGFEKVGLPGCATCHSNHLIVHPTDAMLGMGEGAVCVQCHQSGKFGAPIAGAETARALRSGLDELKQHIATAEMTLTQAEQLGMEVSAPRFALRKASDALTNARSLVHTFRVEPVAAALTAGENVVTDVQAKADHALQEHTWRRIWLVGSLVPIFLTIAVLLLYIRTLPADNRPLGDH